MQEGINWITVDFLTTFTGAVFVTNIITHFMKDYMPEKMDKKMLALMVAVFVMITNLFIFDKVSSQNIYLSIINSFFVAAAAMGNYEILTTKTKRALLKETEAKKLVEWVKDKEK